MNYMIQVQLLGCAGGKLSWLADFFETFYQDYNILPYVLATKDHVDDSTIDSVDVRAYLILPVT